MSINMRTHQEDEKEELPVKKLNDEDYEHWEEIEEHIAEMSSIVRPKFNVHPTQARD